MTEFANLNSLLTDSKSVPDSPASASEAAPASVGDAVPPPQPLRRGLSRRAHEPPRIVVAESPPAAAGAAAGGQLGRTGWRDGGGGAAHLAAAATGIMARQRSLRSPRALGAASPRGKLGNATPRLLHSPNAGAPQFDARTPRSAASRRRPRSEVMSRVSQMLGSPKVGSPRGRADAMKVLAAEADMLQEFVANDAAVTDPYSEMTPMEELTLDDLAPDLRRLWLAYSDNEQYMGLEGLAALLHHLGHSATEDEVHTLGQILSEQGDGRIDLTGFVSVCGRMGTARDAASAVSDVTDQAASRGSKRHHGLGRAGRRAWASVAALLGADRAGAAAANAATHLTLLYIVVSATLRLGAGIDAGVRWGASELGADALLAAALTLRHCGRCAWAQPQGKKRAHGGAGAAADATALFPVELVAGAAGLAGSAAGGAPALRAGKLLLARHLPDILRSATTTLGRQGPFARIIHALLLIVCIVHGLACGFLALAHREGDAATWSMTYMHDFSDRSMLLQYLQGLDWAVKTSTGLTRGPPMPATDLQIVYALVTIMIGVMVYAWFIAGVASALATPTAYSRFRTRLEQVSGLLEYKQLPQHFREECLDYYRHMYRTTGSCSDNVGLLFADLPPELARKINIELGQSMLHKVPLFRGVTDRDFLAELVTRLVPSVVVPGTKVCQEGRCGGEFYLITHGRFDVNVKNLGTVATLGPGTAFGEIAVLLPGVRRTATVVATAYSTVLTLSAHDFNSVSRLWPQARAAVDVAARPAIEDALRRELQEEARRTAERAARGSRVQSSVDTELSPAASPVAGICRIGQLGLIAGSQWHMHRGMTAQSGSMGKLRGKGRRVTGDTDPFEPAPRAAARGSLHSLGRTKSQRTATTATTRASLASKLSMAPEMTPKVRAKAAGEAAAVDRRGSVASSRVSGGAARRSSVVSTSASKASGRLKLRDAIRRTVRDVADTRRGSAMPGSQAGSVAGSRRPSAMPRQVGKLRTPEGSELSREVSERSELGIASPANSEGRMSRASSRASSPGGGRRMSRSSSHQLSPSAKRLQMAARRLGRSGMRRGTCASSAVSAGTASTRGSPDGGSRRGSVAVDNNQLSVASLLDAVRGGGARPALETDRRRGSHRSAAGLLAPLSPGEEAAAGFPAARADTAPSGDCGLGVRRELSLELPAAGEPRQRRGSAASCGSATSDDGGGQRQRTGSRMGHPRRHGRKTVQTRVLGGSHNAEGQEPGPGSPNSAMDSSIMRMLLGDTSPTSPRSACDGYGRESETCELPGAQPAFLCLISPRPPAAAPVSPRAPDFPGDAPRATTHAAAALGMAMGAGPVAAALGLRGPGAEPPRSATMPAAPMPVMDITPPSPERKAQRARGGLSLAIPAAPGDASAAAAPARAFSEGDARHPAGLATNGTERAMGASACTLHFEGSAGRAATGTPPTEEERGPGGARGNPLLPPPAAPAPLQTSPPLVGSSDVGLSPTSVSELLVRLHSDSAPQGTPAGADDGAPQLPGGPLRRVTYASREAAALPADAAECIAASSRARNAALGVTGYLVHTPPRFFQTIEGPHGGVGALMESIKRDQRHTGVEVVEDVAVARRLYPSWKMEVVQRNDAMRLGGIIAQLLHHAAAPRAVPPSAVGSTCARPPGAQPARGPPHPAAPTSRELTS